MADTPTPETLREAYLDAQDALWAQWRETIQQMETLGSPECAWWSFPYRATQDMTPAVQAGASPPEFWLALWCDAFIHRQGALAAMVEWNRRVRETQARINREFLEAWTQAVAGPQAPLPTSAIEDESLATLRASVAKALGVSDERTVRSLSPPRRRAAPGEGASDHQKGRPPPAAA